MLFAADGRGMVYILSQGSSLDQMAVIGVLPTPTNILSICSGFFLSAHDMGRMMDTPIAKEARPSPSATDPPCQVLLAGKNGQVYVLADFNIYPWFKTDFDIASIVRFRPSTLSPDQPDLVICAGKSSTVAVYHKGELVSEIHAQDWPRCMTIGDLDEVGKDMLVLGHHDHTIEVFSYDIANSPDMQT
ncbi:hypothetical protein DM01DRAFT_1390419 [Hesseltinella vesiculosa]|uniref:Cleavage/polyadenylation specificity factor A subunit N-terminal domain-containing protein n=1 Tax=Hesseltinella vesiculosa TaxID=101127 RepID=A0A1X2GHZ4_9FUNG|nr:hypothetical protein DM01DRAFT_1390419 [Hesseltinella vesiculosa]